jgi:general nucleoside transport system ATP-binding protein
MAAAPPILELRGITKRFPGIIANDHIDFDLNRGEVHALLGENGAGKSTLMNVVYGLYRADEGEIVVGGKPVVFHSPSDAIRAGIGMVHQHFMLIPVMTVAENIVLGTEPTAGGVFLDHSAADKRVRELAATFNFAVDPDARIQNISVGQQQRVEILKALYRGADILILDEPTAVLTPQEASDLFEILRSLTDDGMAVIFISHKLHEVLDIADRISVLRRGKLVETVPREGVTEQRLAELMVGREVVLRVDKPPAQPGAALLRIEDLEVADDRGLPAVKGLSFDVRAGEIVGIAGVDGNGQTELIEALTGLRKASAGRILVDDHEISHDSVRGRLAAGLGHIPEDRLRHGIILDFTLAENVSLHDYGQEPISRFGWLHPSRMIAAARRLIAEFDVRGGRPTSRGSELSGGNQQKLVIAREVSRDPRLLIAAQPTRGLDVGAMAFVHSRLVTERDEGRAVLLISLELDEIQSLSDRILVIYEGQIVGEYPPDVSAETLGLAMIGATRDQEAAA